MSAGTGGTVLRSMDINGALNMYRTTHSNASRAARSLTWLPARRVTRRALTVCLAVAALAGAASAIAQTSWLVTPEEASASRASPMPLVPRTTAAPGSPRINLLTPALPGTVNSPTRIQVRFETTLPATIKPESFKVMYGAFKLDITGRITSSSKVTAQGIDVPEAALPKGSHRLWLEIQDSAGRQGMRQVDFVVE